MLRAIRTLIPGIHVPVNHDEPLWRFRLKPGQHHFGVHGYEYRHENRHRRAPLCKCSYGTAEVESVLPISKVGDVNVGAPVLFELVSADERPEGRPIRRRM